MRYTWLSSFFCSLSLHLPHLFLPAVMPRFAEQVEVAIEALSTNPPQSFEENEFIDASRLVYDGVRDIRKAVLMIRVRPLPSLKEENSHSQILWNGLTAQQELDCEWMCLEMLTEAECSNLFLPSSIYLKRLIGYFANVDIWTICLFPE